MANKIKDTSLCVNTSNYVAMANNLLKGKSTLEPLEAKLLRLIIMQVKIDDDYISAYKTKASELAKVLNLSEENFYRDFKKLCDKLTEKKVSIEYYDKHNKCFKTYPWMSACEYNNGEIYLKINTSLAPYLIGLRNNGHYTQYVLEQILRMKNIYSIRIYELLKMKLPTTPIPHGGIKISIDNEEIREFTNTEKTHKQNTHFKTRILDVAVKEISDKSDFTVTYIQKKAKSKTYDTVEFLCKSLWDNGQEMTLKEKCLEKVTALNEVRKKMGKKKIMFSDIKDGYEFTTLEEFEKHLYEYLMVYGL